MKECSKCIHEAVCETAKACGGFVNGCKHFKEQKKGRWINGQTGYTCSECMKQEPTKRFIYCPNCGADMRGAEE